MVQIENLPLVLTGIGLTASILYYTMILRNANKTQQLQQETRQLQLYTTTFQPGWNKEWMSSLIEIMYRTEWKDYEDFMEKYGPEKDLDLYTSFIQVIELFQMIGLFVEQGAIDLDIVIRHNGNFTVRLWEKVESFIKGHRRATNNPMHWSSFEYLYEEVKKLNP
jgi:hypothetical protein